MCKISIVIPVYNAETYLDDCIKSVLDQDYRDFELILVDDGSSDASFEICRGYAAKDNRIHAFSKSNGGVSSARNYGISKASGTFLTFIDSDDYVAKNYCSSLLKYMTDDVRLVVLGLQKAHADGTVVPIPHRFAAGKYAFCEIVDKIIDDGTLSGFSIHSSCAVLFDLNVIKNNFIEFNEIVKYNEDGLFNTEYVLKSQGSVYIDYHQYVYFYRTNLESATALVDLFGEKYVQSMRSVDRVLNQYASKCDCIVPQIKRRAATIALSRFIYLAQKQTSSPKVIKELLSDKLVKEGFRLLDYASMSKGKLLFCCVVRSRNYWLIDKVLRMRFGTK